MILNAYFWKRENGQFFKKTNKKKPNHKTKPIQSYYSEVSGISLNLSSFKNQNKINLKTADAKKLKRLSSFKMRFVGKE